MKFGDLFGKPEAEEGATGRGLKTFRGQIRRTYPESPDTGSRESTPTRLSNRKSGPISSPNSKRMEEERGARSPTRGSSEISQESTPSPKVASLLTTDSIKVGNVTYYSGKNPRSDGYPPPPMASPSVFADWSGRGSHVDYDSNEKPPLEEGRFLGQGVMEPVYETVIQQQAFAWKRIHCRQKVGKAHLKEIEILKKLSHQHIIRLVGTYTWRHNLGLLLYPVAVCDLHTLLEDTATSRREEHLSEVTRQRLNDLDMIPYHNLIQLLGCIVSAVEYLHSKEIRHKDLKPSNILLSKDHLWLTDFGSATDFSMLSKSLTENGERGTPKYFAPEVAQFEPSGRAADIFSLGCIALELVTLAYSSSLQEFTTLQECRSRGGKSFQENLDDIHEFMKTFGKKESTGRKAMFEISRMLSQQPDSRPSATEARRNLEYINICGQEDDTRPMFRDCCRSIISLGEHSKKIAKIRADSARREDSFFAQKIVFEADLERSQEEIRAFQGHYELLQYKNNVLQEENRVLQEKTNVFQGENQDLHKNLLALQEYLQHEKEDFRKETRVLQKENKVLQEKYQKLEQFVPKLSTQLDYARAQCAAMESAISAPPFQDQKNSRDTRQKDEG